MQSMILSVCKAGDKIILPRNVHKSAINALVLCGAIPVYVNPEVNAQLGISLGMESARWRRLMDENPDAVAVLVNNPNLLWNLFGSADYRKEGSCKRNEGAGR